MDMADNSRDKDGWILVVDDDSDLCDLTLKTLARNGHAARTAQSGREAIELAARDSPSLILLDYRLPDITGREVASALAERGLDIPFVVMTGQGDEKLAVEIMKQGASDYLIKDTELIDRIPSVVDRILKAMELRTRLREAEEDLRLAANVFSHSREGILITDRDANIVEVNPAFTEITGYGRDEALGKNPRFLGSGRQTREFYADLWETLLIKGHWSGEIWNRRKDGALFAEHLTISSVRGAGGETRNYIAQFSDITTLKEYQNQLETIAHYDSLTGLPNRLLLADRMIQAMAQAPRQGHRIAIVYLDLDGFKAVNDAHGHDLGDRLLATLAARMMQTLRDGDTLARLGGDEFVAVLGGLPDFDSSAPILNRLLEAASRPVPIGDVTLQVSASLGVSVYPQTEDVDADQLLRQADQAMYQAKQAGKNRYYVFDAEHDRNVRGRYESLKRIQVALENGEFTLFYQPKVNMRTGELVGAEALIRWNHPERGLLAPGAFLSIIENHPISIDVGEWVIDTALAQIEAWRGEGLSIPVSVNVGALQLQQPDFVSRLRELLARHPRVLPGDLELEILETSALEDIATVSELMRSCRELGVAFALDDFGTGYSSLLYLKRLPAGLIKLDQSFIRDMLNDPEDLAILEGVIGLATSFRRKLIAEGVETVAHGEILLCMGCEFAQGYAIARPMPAKDLRRWIGTWELPAVWKELAPVRRDRLPILFASVEQRAWAFALEGFLSGNRDAPPEMDPLKCGFGRWLAQGGRDLLDLDDDDDIETFHLKTHSLAASLIALKEEGRAGELGPALGELHSLNERLMERLRERY